MKKRSLSIVVAFIFGILGTLIPLVGVSQTASFSSIQWSNTTPSPLGAAETMGAVLGGKLYVFGGYNSSWVPTSNAFVFDGTKENWTKIASVPKPLTHSGVASDGKDIFLAGGYEGRPTGGQLFATTAVWRYSPSTNTWSSMPPLPLARGSGGFTNLNGILHFFGGADVNRIDQGDHWSLDLKNIAAGWKDEVALPNARSHLADAAVNGKIYAVGGQYSFDDNLTTVAAVNVWDPANPDVWTTAAPLPRAKSHIGAATLVVNNQILVLGGETSHTNASREVLSYSPSTNTWKTLTSMPTPLHSGAAGMLNGKLYYSSGAPSFSKTTLKGTPVFVN